MPRHIEVMKTETATELLQRLSPDEIRQRLEATAAEKRALRTLLRAAIRMQKPRHLAKVIPDNVPASKIA
jgi:hypothetical protein